MYQTASGRFFTSSLSHSALFVVSRKYVLQEGLSKCCPRVSYKDMYLFRTKWSPSEFCWVLLTVMHKCPWNGVCLREFSFGLRGFCLSQRMLHRGFHICLSNQSRNVTNSPRTQDRRMVIRVSTWENLYYSNQGLALSFQKDTWFFFHYPIGVEAIAGSWRIPRCAVLWRYFRTTWLVLATFSCVSSSTISSESL